MWRTPELRTLLFAIGIAFLCACSAVAEEVPVYHTLPKYQTPVPYSDQRNWHVTFNLGSTGARGWVYGHRGNSLASREIMVKRVEPGSPADGILRPYDFITGAATPPDTSPTEWNAEPPLKAFDSDARMAMARAVTWAESDQGAGKLKLLRVRDGVTEPVIVEIPVLGTFSETAPFDCPKTERILQNAANFVASRMPPDGYFGLSGALNGLLLLAMDKPEYLDLVRRTACRMSLNHTINDAGHETWRWGYQNLFLTEYYLATGDERVLPTIEEYCDKLAKGQCNPGTWGHRAVPDFIPPGYGSMNQSGLVCFLSMVLARQAGVDVDEQALENSIRFYGYYAGMGGIPYGDHPPHPHPTCNGKNGSAAAAFFALHADPAAQWFARMCASASSRQVEEGHTGNFFSQTWSPVGAGFSPKNGVIGYWQRNNSYRDLARRWDGSFVVQPLPHRREGDLGTINYIRRGGMWATGGFSLGYLAKTNRLSILGRSDSVFGANPPKELLPALKLYHANAFTGAAEAAANLNTHADPRISSMARQLQSIAANRLGSIVLTLADMQTRLDAGDLYPLKAQLQAIESLLDRGDPRLAPFRQAVEDPAHAEVLADGQTYYRHTSEGTERLGPWGFGMYGTTVQDNDRARAELSKIARNGKGGYADMASTFLAAHPSLNLRPVRSVLGSQTPDGADTSWSLLTEVPHEAGTGVPSQEAGTWKNLHLPSKELAGKGPFYLRRTFALTEYDGIADLWLVSPGKGSMTVYLNEALILDARLDSWPKTWEILLKPCTRELLKDGQNTLAVRLSDVATPGTFKLDLKTSAQTLEEAE